MKIEYVTNSLKHGVIICDSLHKGQQAIIGFLEPIDEVILRVEEPFQVYGYNTRERQWFTNLWLGKRFKEKKLKLIRKEKEMKQDA